MPSTPRREVLTHRPAQTAAERAAYLRIGPDLVAKTVAVHTTGGASALAVIPAYRRLDMRLMREALHDRRARLCSEAEIRDEFPDFELGCLPPDPEPADLEVYVDPEMLEHDYVVIPSGEPSHSVRAAVGELFGEAVHVAPIAGHPEWYLAVTRD